MLFFLLYYSSYIDWTIIIDGKNSMYDYHLYVCYHNENMIENTQTAILIKYK